MVVNKKKSAPKHLTAKLLVLGDKQVGKSAAIVRYTTDRYIQEYGKSTNDWLYQHSVGYEAKQNAHLSVELLEQKDIHFSSSSNFFATSQHLNNNNNTNDNNYSNSNNSLQSSSLASRVALDQQIDNEFHEKQQLLSKLHWANAYIVMYAINDVSSFNKAIKYLNLIANHINSPLHDSSHKKSSAKSPSTSSSSSSSSSSTSSSTSPTATSANHNCNNNNSNNNQTNGLAKAVGNNNRCAGSTGSRGSAGSTSSTSSVASSSVSSPSSSSGSSASYNTAANSGGKFISACANKLSPSPNANTCACSSSTNRRPILLLANKQDLELSGVRQVSARDGRMLAMRHQSIFTELSVANSHRFIKNAFATLIDQLDSSCLRVDSPQRLNEAKVAARISQWKPTIELALNQSSINLTAPVWGSLIKSQVVSSTVVQSSRIAPVSRIEPTDVRLITPLGSLSRSIETSRLSRPNLTPQSAEILGKRCQIESLSTAKPKPFVAQRLTTSHRYENLKTSFKRASMAINAVTHSSKALASRSNTVKVTNLEAVAAASSASSHSQTLINQQPSSITSRYSEPIIESAPLPVSPMTAEKMRKVSTVSASNAPTSWIRSHIWLTRDRNTPVSSSNPKLDHFHESGDGESSESRTSSGGEKVSRTLFKYKNRRKTVAFDHIKSATGNVAALNGTSVTDSIVEVGSELSRLPDTATIESKKNARGGSLTKNNSSRSGSSSTAYNSTRSSSGRSSSSLSASTDAYYSALLDSWRNPNDRTPSSAGSTSVCSSGTYGSTTGTANAAAAGNFRPPTSQQQQCATNKRETDTTTSNDDDHYHQTTDNQQHKQQPRRIIADRAVETHYCSLYPVSGATFQVQSGPTTPHDSSVTGAKKRYHIVKTMQSTLTNLTRSSNVSAQAAKKSFCNVLFRQSNTAPATATTSSSPQSTSPSSSPLNGAATMIPAPTTRKSTPTTNIINRVQAEQILTMPLVGYCQ